MQYLYKHHTSGTGCSAGDIIALGALRDTVPNLLVI